MIDYIKLRISRNYWELIKDNLQGKLNVKYNPKDDRVLYTAYKLETFEIRLYSMHIDVAGSIHSFHNRINGISEDNRDDFSHEEFCIAVEKLEQMVGIELRLETLTQVEMGVNLQVGFHAKNFLRQNILMWDFDRPIVDEDKGERGHFKEFKTSQFYIKTYDKGRQLQLGYEEMRLELKYIRSPYIRALGIRNLNDLMDQSKFKILARDLFQRFNSDLLIVDTVDVSFIKDRKDNQLLTQGMNDVYWEQLKTEPSRHNRKHKKPIHPMTVSRRKKAYMKLLDKYDLMKRKALVMALLRDKIYELSGVDVSVN